MDYGQNPLPEWPLVAVQWADAYGVGANWEPIDELPDVEHIIYSVGWLVKDGDHVIVLVPHVSPANDQIDSYLNGCGDMSIPKSQVRNMVVLIPARPKNQAENGE
jgi:hypothetical protein